jgi:hypothetical protein
VRCAGLLGGVSSPLRIAWLIGTIVINGAVSLGEGRRRVVEQATDSGAAEHGHLQKSLKRRPMAMIPSGGVIGDAFSVGRRRFGFRRSASSDSTLSNLPGVGRS